MTSLAPPSPAPPPPAAPPGLPVPFETGPIPLPAPIPAGPPFPDPHTPILTPEQIAQFREEGYTVVRGIIRPEELAAAAAEFDRLMAGDDGVPIPGNDRGVHTPGLMNVTAFTLYHDLSTLGVFAALEARAAGVAAQLYAGGPPMARDYEQLLRKLPRQPDAVFPPHSDAHYWPKSASGAFDMRTATCSIAVNAATRDNGCLWVLPGSHRAGAVYPGAVGKLAGSRAAGGGVLDVELKAEDAPRRAWLPLGAGDMSVHEEFVFHGSDGNGADATRDTLIFAYRAASMIELERRVGFRHSYNDRPEVLKAVREHVFP
jgi:phytanoyl-CoA hydroxylase